MATHTCINCGKTFNKLFNYLSHIEKRKTPCLTKEKEKLLRTCSKCNKEFHRKDYLKKHIITCKGIIETPVIIINEGNTTNNITNNNQNITNNNQYITNNNQQITNNITNINFQIVEFGSEKIDKIDLGSILDSGSIFLKLIEEIHCNPNIPENHNILITDKSRNSANVFEDEKWISRTKTDIMRRLINRSYVHLVDLKEKLVDKYKEKIDEEIKKIIFDEFDTLYLEHKRLLQQSINNIIYDNKKMIKETYKKHQEAKVLRDSKYFIQEEEDNKSIVSMYSEY